MLISFSGAGGMELMMSRLVKAFVERGLKVDLLTVKQNGPYFEDASHGVNIIKLPFSHTYANLLPLVNYLRNYRPESLLVSKDRAIRTASIAKRLAKIDFRLVGKLGTNLSASLDHKYAVQRFFRTATMRWHYRYVDSLISVSQGVAEDTMSLTGLPTDRLPVIYEPAIPPDIIEQASRLCGHPWLDIKTQPVIVGAGRLTEQKDFPTLLRAFARVRHKRQCRLVIFGEGGQRNALWTLARDLGIAQDFDLPGHSEHLYAALAKADVFALSSRWEGLGNVLVEALAVGTPVISTDCHSGPREILLDGRIGPLGPVGNDEALAGSLITVLDHPPDPSTWQASLTRFKLEHAVTNYLRILQPD